MEKKRRWTEAEDAVLFHYVKEHGERDWNGIAKATGLDRCGKSCRSRWLDHLRPNLKKGPITPEEEQLIVQLQANMGNKWAKIATHLPGRTDNEIKNFWNGMKKKHKRVHIPLEPAPVLDPPSMAKLQPYPCSQSQDNIPLPEIVAGYFDLRVKMTAMQSHAESLQRMGIRIPHSFLSLIYPATVPAPAAYPVPVPAPAPDPPYPISVPAPVLSPVISSDSPLELDNNLEMDFDERMTFLNTVPASASAPAPAAYPVPVPAPAPDSISVPAPVLSSAISSDSPLELDDNPEMDFDEILTFLYAVPAPASEPAQAPASGPVPAAAAYPVPALAPAPAPAPASYVVPVPTPVISSAISSDPSLEFDPSSLVFDPSLDLEKDLGMEGLITRFVDSLPDDIE